MSRITSPVIRDQVRERAKQRCEYCQLPDTYSSYGFHVDHIVPVNKHGGSDDLSNLAWSCFRCNTTKAGDISSYDFETKELTPLYNPRIHQWNMHFEMDGAFIIGKTPIGRVTIRILEMNAERQLKARQLLLMRGEW